MSKAAKFLLILSLLTPTWTTAFAPPIQLKIESDWHGAEPQDVQAVLDSTTVAISPYIGGRTLDKVVVRNEEKGPISLYERSPNDEYIVLLDVKGRYWSQMAYQFSHEVCHLLTNYDLAPNNVSHQQWFEESLCEAFSLFTLKELSAQWASNPPYAHWKEYAPEIQKYVDGMMKQKHRSFAPKLSSWYAEQKSILEENPYAKDRELNEKMASHLLQVFAKRPEYWAAINYLNLGDETDDKSFAKYIDDWYSHTPEPLRPPVAEIRELLLAVGNNTKNKEN